MGKQGPLLAADAAPELQDHVPPVVGIPGQQEDFQLLPEALRLLPGGGELLLGQLPELRVPEQGPGLLPAALRALQGPPGLHHRRQLLQLPLEGLEPPAVPIDRRVRQLGLQVLLPERQFS